MNNQQDRVIIFGSGHLAVQVAGLLQERGYDVIRVPHKHAHPTHDDLAVRSVLENLKLVLRDAGIDKAKAVYVIDDEDNRNLQFALAVMASNNSVRIIVSLFNENLAPHLGATHPHISIRNPAKIAAPAFVDALYTPVNRYLRYTAPSMPRQESGLHTIFRDQLLVGLLAGFLLLFVGGSVFFHFSEKLSWLDSAYFVTSTMATVGYGDISLRASAPAAKIFGMFLMVSSQILMWTTFSLIVDRLFKKRAQLALGVRRYRIKGHVIVCGLGRVGHHIVEELLRRGAKVLVIESDENGRFLDFARQLGIRVLIGDATLPKNLQNAGVEQAAGVIAVVNDDLKNLEIGLNARSFRPGLRLILRIFDSEVAHEIRERLDVHLTLSTSAIAAEEFVRLLQSSEA